MKELEERLKKLKSEVLNSTNHWKLDQEFRIRQGQYSYKLSVYLLKFLIFFF